MFKEIKEDIGRMYETKPCKNDQSGGKKSQVETLVM